jgi:hypothetical protein
LLNWRSVALTPTTDRPSQCVLTRACLRSWRSACLRGRVRVAMDSKIVSRELWKVVRPLLRDAGWTSFSSRTARRFTQSRIDVVNFQSFNSHLAYARGIVGRHVLQHIRCRLKGCLTNLVHADRVPAIAACHQSAACDASSRCVHALSLRSTLMGAEHHRTATMGFVCLSYFRRSRKP